MISVSQAKEIIVKNIRPLNKELIHIDDALNCFLAEDVIAPVNLPLFNQSAMDGYAFKFNDKNDGINIIDEIPAGDIRNVEISKGEGVRIFTGAKVPDDCDTVVMQELTEVEGSVFKINDLGLKLGGNIRKQGSQIKQGDLALQKGTVVTPAVIGFLASLGFQKVPIYKSPSVAILTTGNELIKPGNNLKPGQIYESNSFMLKAAFKSLDIKADTLLIKDEYTATKETIAQALLKYDVVVLSGGISVGDYDFVKRALEENAVEQLFYKVKQKPGKPLYFGKKGNKLVFALPGNPAAALSCFYHYVFPAINILKGNNSPFLIEKNLKINQKYSKKSGRAEFLKGICNETTVDLLEGQGSDVLQSFAQANCLVYVSDEIQDLEKNDLVKVFLLPIK